MKKNIVAIICMLAMVVSLSACASNNSGLVVASAPCIEAAPEEAKVIRVTENIMFDWDSDAIRADQEPVLNDIAGYLVDYPDTFLVIEGYASEEGAEDYNLDLSTRRAESVRGALHERGANPAKMRSVTGKGETTIFGELLKQNRKVLVITVE